MTLTLDQALHQAVGHFQAGRLPEVEQLCRAILASVPDHADALHLLGAVAHLCGHSAAAVELVGRSVAVGPTNAAAWNTLGEAYRGSGRAAEAEQSYRRAIAIAPDFAPAHSNLAIVLSDARQTEAAIAEAETAVRLSPRLIEAWNTLGNARLDAGRQDAAVDAYRHALAVNPSAAMTHNNLGSALEQAEQLDDAAAGYARAAELQPAMAEAWNNLGNVRQKQLNLDDAGRCFARAVEARPDFADAHWNLGLLALARGDHATGWSEYAWRIRCAHTIQHLRDYPGRPMWDGSPLNGRTVLLYREQGFGDAVQFARFARRIADTGGRVILDVPPELKTLLATVDGAAAVTSDDPPPEAFDVHCPLMSVAGLLNLSLDECRSAPYLSPDAAKVAAWREEFAAYPGRKVGLVWSGRPVPDPRRSCEIADLAPLLALDGVTFVSLQKGPAADALKISPLGDRVLHLDERLHDFADTAAAMAALDHLVTIDTAAAHVAGATGVPTTVLLPKPADWRWLLDREDSPWYPTLRLVRQTTRGDWSPVIARVVADLSAHPSNA